MAKRNSSSGRSGNNRRDGKSGGPSRKGSSNRGSSSSKGGFASKRTGPRAEPSSDKRKTGSKSGSSGDRFGRKRLEEREKGFDRESSAKRSFSQRDERPSKSSSFKKSSSKGRSSSESREGSGRFSTKRPSSRGNSEAPRKRSFSQDEDRPSRSSSFKKPASKGRSSFEGKEDSDRFSKRPSSRGRGDAPGKRSFSREDDRPSKGKSASSDYQPIKKYTKKDQKDRRDAKRSSSDAPLLAEKIRLNRFIANSGVCSRRDADELIKMGLITVNGKSVTELGYKVNPGDVVKYEDRVLRAEKPVYILLNKPKGYLTTTDDPQERSTVMHLIANAVKERVYPVGRLDRNTTGLLLLTNDGELADKLMHPSYNVKKIYKVELDRPFNNGDLEKLLEGVQLDEGKAVVDDAAIISDDRKTVGVEIHIGWNRVVRRIFEALNYEVVKLDRSVYAGLDKKDLPRGHWRFLRQDEIVRLKHYK